MATETFKGRKLPKNIDPDLLTYLEDLERTVQRLAVPVTAPIISEENTEAKVSAVKMKAGTYNIPILPAGYIVIMTVEEGTIKSEQGRMKLQGDFTVASSPGQLMLVSDGRQWVELARRGSGGTWDCPVIINENGDACNPVFRIEGDTFQNLFYVDGVNERVGINTATPNELFDVRGIGAAPRLQVGWNTGVGIGTDPTTAALIVAGQTILNLNNTQSDAFQIQVATVVKVQYDTTGSTDTLEIGNGSAVNVNFGSATRISSHILPVDLSNNLDLGADPSNWWRTLYVGNIVTNTAQFTFTLTGTNYTVAATDTAVGVTGGYGGGVLTVTLPDATLNEGRQILVKDLTGTAGTSGNILRIASVGGTIEGAATFDILTGFGGAIFMADVSNWWKING